MEKLRACPHCGREVELDEIPPHTHVFATFMLDHLGSWHIECFCGAGMIDEDKQRLIDRWNCRAEPEARALTEWINVKDELPEFGQSIVIRWDEHTDIAVYWRGMVCPHWRAQYYGTIDLSTVTHWMPLPTIPTKEVTPCT